MYASTKSLARETFENIAVAEIISNFYKNNAYKIKNLYRHLYVDLIKRYERFKPVQYKSLQHTNTRCLGAFCDYYQHYKLYLKALIRN